MPQGLHWTEEEDEMLRRLVAEHGTKRWAYIASIMGTKGSKQCRRRWINHLDMADKKETAWTEDEDRRLVQAHLELGNRWTEIARMFGDRTDNAVKNRWHALAKKHPEILRREAAAAAEEALPRPKRQRRGGAAADAVTYHDALNRAYSGGTTGSLPTPFDQPGGGHSLYGGTNGAAAAAAAAAAQHVPGFVPVAGGGHVALPYGYEGLQIVVNQGALNPWEQQLVMEMNAAPVPLSIFLQQGPVQLHAAVPGTAPGETAADLLTNRSSWRAFVEGLPDPVGGSMLIPAPSRPQAMASRPGAAAGAGAGAGAAGHRAEPEPKEEQRAGGSGGGGSLDGQGCELEGLLSWFNNLQADQIPQGVGSGAVRAGSGGRGRVLTRAASRSNSASGNLGPDHFDLLGRLLSKGLQARASSEEGALAAAAAALNAPGGPSSNPPSNPNSLPLPPLPPLASLRATRSSRRSADLSGLAVAGAPTSLTLSSGQSSGSGGGGSGSASLDMPRRGSGGRSRHMAALKSQTSPGTGAVQSTGRGGTAAAAPATDAAAPAAAMMPVPADAAFADVLLAPTFTSQEIQVLMEALGAKS